jgi:hypothetical protein
LQPSSVKPFVKSNKNDFVDAEAIAEAVDRKKHALRSDQNGRDQGVEESKNWLARRMQGGGAVITLSM